MTPLRPGLPVRGLAAGWALAACLALPAAIACSRAEGGSVLAAPADSPQVFSEVAPFELVERSGKPVTRADLLGRPWVASFVFTRCSGPCPRVVGTLRKLQARLKEGGPRIVTISVDPEWDTPEVLRRYAADLGADPARWLFLTGRESAIHRWIRDSFKSGVERAPEGSVPPGEAVTHRTQLVAVDKKGRVRGYYAGESEADLDLLVARLEFLAAEKE